MSGKVVHDRLVFYPGDEVFAEGDLGNWAYLVQSGSIAIVKNLPSGGEVVLGTLGPGRVFGEMALIDDRPRMASARAVAESTLVLIDRATFRAKMRKTDPFIRGVLQNLTSNLRSITDKHLEAIEPHEE